MRNSILTALATFLLANVPVFSDSPEELLDQIASRVQTLVDSGKVVGAQLTIGQNDQLLLNRAFGVRSIEDETPVDDETMFCLGSCSKPIASAVVMTLVDDAILYLDKNIEAWLPEFGFLKTAAGDSTRSPNLGELLSHHGGIYSQKKGMTRQQTRWIRDFGLSLEQAVDGIAQEPLFAKPGEKYAYSGAGYCVLGRVAEVAAECPFELLLQARLCEPLGLVHTTYFPSRDNRNVASGSLKGEINKETPHLSQSFKLPLIGGSMYSTAEESLRFLQAVLKQATSGEEILMSEEQFRSYITPSREQDNYAFGWGMMKTEGKRFGLSHSGSLASSRAMFQINRQSGVCVVIHYTVSEPRNSSDVARELSVALRPLMDPQRLRHKGD